METQRIDPKRETHARIAAETSKWLAEFYRIVLVEEGIEYPTLIDDVLQMGDQIGDILGETLQHIREEEAREEVRNPLKPKNIRGYREEVFKKNLVRF